MAVSMASDASTTTSSCLVFDAFQHLLHQMKQSDIRIIVCHEPLILVSGVSKTLKPKIKLLNDLGLSGSDLVQTVVWNPSMLRQRLGPAIDAFRTILGSDQSVV
uniref:Uncharacterized protein n=1 Tax=Chenopodium quinoa TaxID=63459 RepID=A0A803MI10_CHEQI